MGMWSDTKGGCGLMIGATKQFFFQAPLTYKVFGVRIDQSNSNPETSVTYTDDAIGVTDWTTEPIFKDIKPCLLLNGVVNYYLNPNNFAQKADGTASDIASGADGDVMIEFPKFAFMMYTEGNYVYAKITNANNAQTIDSRFHYYAFTRDVEGDRDKLYLGAYLGYNLSSKLRSLSGKTPVVSLTIGTARTLANANGTGYDQISDYPLLALQFLYVIKYKNLDSQIALGKGFTAATNTASHATGGTNALGMYYGEQTGTLQMKFAGIEDFWGNCFYWIDGLFSNASRHILTAFKNFNDTGSGYTDRGQGATTDINGYISAIQGNTESGFITKTAGGSATTYYCDSGTLYASYLPAFGSDWTNNTNAGAFRIRVIYSSVYTNTGVSARLMYL